MTGSRSHCLAAMLLCAFGGNARIRRCTSAVALLAAVRLISGPAAHAAVIEAKLRKPAPAFTLTDARGASVALPAYKGKVVLLNFWATWCHGCQFEIPWFIEFQEKYRSAGLQVIGVSMDDDGWKSVRPYLERKKLNYEVVIGSAALGKRYGLDSMPLSLLIDSEGKIADSHSGVVDRNAWEAEIRALLAGQKPFKP
ncbi:MAG: TlpA disulfide reductase family protein [Bryobacteraceae bacterium]